MKFPREAAGGEISCQYLQAVGGSSGQHLVLDTVSKSVVGAERARAVKRRSARFQASQGLTIDTQAGFWA